MTYQVIITENAKQNLREAYLRAAKHAPRTAARWLARFEKALNGLSTFPHRCPLAPENEFVAPEIRQLFFGKRLSIYRALFIIEENKVRVLHIRWGGMEFATEEDLGL